MFHLSCNTTIVSAVNKTLIRLCRLASKCASSLYTYTKMPHCSNSCIFGLLTKLVQHGADVIKIRCKCCVQQEGRQSFKHLQILQFHIRGLFKYECKSLHNLLHIYATTKCHTFLERTICRLSNGTKHKETLTLFLELQTLI